MIDETLLTVDEVAKLLQVSRMTILNQIKSGNLPAYQISRKRHRIRESELWEWLDRLKVETKTNQQ